MDLVIKIICTGHQLYMFSLVLLANVLYILQVVPLVGHLHAMLCGFLIDLRLELFLLFQGS